MSQLVGHTGSRSITQLYSLSATKAADVIWWSARLPVNHTAKNPSQKSNPNVWHARHFLTRSFSQRSLFRQHNHYCYWIPKKVWATGMRLTRERVKKQRVEDKQKNNKSAASLSIQRQSKQMVLYSTRCVRSIKAGWKKLICERVYVQAYDGMWCISANMIMNSILSVYETKWMRNTTRGDRLEDRQEC